MNNKPIAFLDSGIGGLTVFEKVKKILPNENYLYFGDLKNLPYGNKTKEQLIEFTDNVFKFFEQKDVKVVVMACNTTSASAYDVLKDKYSFKIYPIIQSCAKIIANLEIDSVGVFATESTINSGVYGRELKKYNPNLQVFEMSCPPWVNLVEENTQNTPEGQNVVEHYLKEMLKNNPDKIVLGCTHYPYLMEVLQKFAPENIFIDPSKYFADFIKQDLADNDMLNDADTAPEKFYVSAYPERFMQTSSLFYEVKKLPELVNFDFAKA